MLLLLSSSSFCPLVLSKTLLPVHPSARAISPLNTVFCQAAPVTSKIIGIHTVLHYELGYRNSHVPPWPDTLARTPVVSSEVVRQVDTSCSRCNEEFTGMV